MLISYPVKCPYEKCDWTGNLVPSRLQGGAGAEIASMQAGWFQCPRCERDWEVRIKDEHVLVLPAVERGAATAACGRTENALAGGEPPTDVEARRLTEFGR